MPEVIAVQEFGNQLTVLFDDNTKKIAYPTSGGLWLVKTQPTVTPDLWRWPLDDHAGMHVSSEWDDGRGHTGIDLNFTGIAGTPIYAISDGFVVGKGFYSAGNGHVVKLSAIDGSYYDFQHMQSATTLESGDPVSKGDFIGSVGSSGDFATGPHLHFATSNTGWSGVQPNFASTVNPRDFMAARGVPIPW